MSYHLLEWLSSKRQVITRVGKDVETREFICTIDGNVNWWTIMENSMEFPQKIKNRTNILSNNSTPGYNSKGNESTILKRYLQFMFTVALFIIA